MASLIGQTKCHAAPINKLASWNPLRHVHLAPLAVDFIKNVAAMIHASFLLYTFSETSLSWLTLSALFVALRTLDYLSSHQVDPK